jgi:hypothetical protein
LFVEKKVVVITEADALATIDTLLNSWNNSNTDSITPVKYISGNQPPRMDLGLQTTVIKIYLPSHNAKPNDLGANFYFATVDRVSIDIKTKKSRSHMLNCYNEARRIVGGATNSPDANFAQLIGENFYDHTTSGYFHCTYDVFLRNWTASHT